MLKNNINIKQRVSMVNYKYVYKAIGITYLLNKKLNAHLVVDKTLKKVWGG